MRKIRRSDGCQPIVRCADRFTAAYRLSAISGLVASPANVGTKNAGGEVRFGIVGLFHSYPESCQIPHRLDLHDRLEEIWGNALTHGAGAFRSGVIRNTGPREGGDTHGVDKDDRPPICPRCGVTMVPAALSADENHEGEWVCLECEELDEER